MLVMRNFGYLGLHSVVHSRSSLARDRLVDFTGELQIRRREEDEQVVKDTPMSLQKTKSSPRNVHVVPQWHDSFVAEPTVHGGRNSQGQQNGKSTEPKKSYSQLYAQELAPLPLQLTPSTRPSVSSSSGLKAQRGRPPVNGEDIEPTYHTSFCNELLCHPRLLHNCPKGNIVVKVEMREMEWKQEYNAYFAHLPESGPSVHNPRRGPFLVQGAFTSCSSRCIDPHFLDEFKVKLPLELRPGKGRESPRVLSLFFSVYRVSFSSRKKWARRLRATKRSGRKVDEIAGDMTGESNEDLDSARNCRLIQLACGFLPLVPHYSLVSDGLHDVNMMLAARNPRRELCENGQIDPSTLIVSEIAELGKDEYGFEDNESVGSGIHLADTASVTSASDSHSMSESTEDWRIKHSRQKSGQEQIALQVRLQSLVGRWNSYTDTQLWLLSCRSGW
jgi:hypothetical protein